MKRLRSGKVYERLWPSSRTTNQTLKKSETGCRGTDGKFPYSESLQSLGAKRSISHEHQKLSRLPPISKAILLLSGYEAIETHSHSYHHRNRDCLHKSASSPRSVYQGSCRPRRFDNCGKVQRVKQTGTGSIELNGVDYTRLDFQAEMRVDETIKGGPAPLSFTFSYSTRAVDSVGNVAEGGLTPDTYRVVFLKRTATGYAYVGPYYPSIPAASKSCGPNWQVKLGEDAYHKVLRRLLDSLCADSTSEEKQSALFVLNWTEDSSAAPFLKAALSLPNVKTNPTLRMSIVSDLLHWKDLSVLALAEEDLFGQTVRSPFFPKSNLVLAISGLEPQISVPLLARVLKLQSLRRGLPRLAFWSTQTLKPL
jgi:hypothetical protein